MQHRVVCYIEIDILEQLTESIITIPNLLKLRKPNVVVEWLTPASYSGDLVLKSQSRGPAILIEVFVIFLVLPGEFVESTLKLGHDSFPPNPFLFTYHPIIDAMYSSY
jgi:hypothetical protein